MADIGQMDAVVKSSAANQKRKSTPMLLQRRLDLMAAGDDELGSLGRQKTKGGKQFAKIWRQNTMNDVK